MKKYKQLGGEDVIKIFKSHGFVIKRTTGSHMRLSLIKSESTYNVTVPLHNSLKTGTLHGLVKDFEICFGKSEAEKFFFN